MRETDAGVLAIMVKAPRAGHVKTRLGAAYQQDAVLSLYRALVEDTVDLGRAVHVRIVAMCPAADEAEITQWLPRDVAVVPQHGVGLAAGLSSTFEQLCTPERRRVIAFNSDSPHLQPSELEAAFAALISNDLVVGPSEDGGYYLVGATRPYPGLFDASAMGRESACAALLGEARRQGLRVALAAEHYDVDLSDDVRRLAAELAHDPSRAPRTAAVLTGWRLIEAKRA